METNNDKLHGAAGRSGATCSVNLGLVLKLFFYVILQQYGGAFKHGCLHQEKKHLQFVNQIQKTILYDDSWWTDAKPGVSSSEKGHTVSVLKTLCL